MDELADAVRRTRVVATPSSWSDVAAAMLGIGGGTVRSYLDFSSSSHRLYENDNSRERSHFYVLTEDRALLGLLALGWKNIRNILVDGR